MPIEFVVTAIRYSDQTVATQIMESKIRTNIARRRQHDAQFTQRSAITSSSLRRQLPTADPSLMSVEAARAVIKATCAQLSHCTAKASNQQVVELSAHSELFSRLTCVPRFFRPIILRRYRSKLFQQLTSYHRIDVSRKLFTLSQRKRVICPLPEGVVLQRELTAFG